MDVKRILITGAGGLLGYSLVNTLKDKFEIFALLRTEPEIRLPGVTYYIIDFNFDGEKISSRAFFIELEEIGVSPALILSMLMLFGILSLFCDLDSSNARVCIIAIRAINNIL